MSGKVRILQSGLFLDKSGSMCYHKAMDTERVWLMKSKMNTSHVFTLLLGIASLLLACYILIANLLRFVPELRSAGAIDFFLEFSVLLVMAAAIVSSALTICGRKQCFLRGFAALYTICNIFILILNLFMLVQHAASLFRLSFDTYDILYFLATRLPGLIQNVLSIASGILLFLAVHHKKRSFLIAAVCPVAAAYVISLIEGMSVFNFPMLFLLIAISALVNKNGQRNAPA